jgi:pimeloyl-ACP methyl ester carboxylesterase
MHINCFGEGSPTVILEAGQADFSVFWDLVQPGIAGFSRVCSYDRAGYGWSETSPYPRTSETMVKELHTLLINAKVERPYVLVGHSLGGALVRVYNDRYPGEAVAVVLVDPVHEDLFVRIPAFRKAVGQQLGLFRVLAPLSSFGMLALAPGSVPNRGLPAEALAQYQAIVVTTGYFDTAIGEMEAFETNLAELRAANITRLGNIPLMILSRGIWDPLPGVSEPENEQAWEAWRAMQAELVALSPTGKQIIADRSGHNIHLDQPQLVIDAVRETVESARAASSTTGATP